MITGWKNINSSDSTSHHDGKTGFNGAELRGVGCLRVPEPGTVPLPCELLPPGRRASGGRWRTPPHRYILPSDHICRRMRTLGQAFRDRIPSLSQFRKVCSAFLCGLQSIFLFGSISSEFGFRPCRAQLLDSVSDGFLPCLKSSWS